MEAQERKECNKELPHECTSKSRSEGPGGEGQDVQGMMVIPNSNLE